MRIYSLVSLIVARHPLRADSFDPSTRDGDPVQPFFVSNLPRTAREINLGR
jgi:hypothetical protein